MKNEKNQREFPYSKNRQLLKRFARPFHQAYTSYFWRVQQSCYCGLGIYKDLQSLSLWHTPAPDHLAWLGQNFFFHMPTLEFSFGKGMQAAG